MSKYNLAEFNLTLVPMEKVKALLQGGNPVLFYWQAIKFFTASKGHKSVKQSTFHVQFKVLVLVYLKQKLGLCLMYSFHI